MIYLLITKYISSLLCIYVIFLLNIIKSTKCFYNLSLCHLTTLFIRYCFLCELLTISFIFIFSIFVFFYLKFFLKFYIFCIIFFFLLLYYFIIFYIYFILYFLFFFF